MKKTEILENMKGAHERLLRALDGLTEEEATRKGLNPKWSVKDCLAHIAAWEATGVGVITEIGNGTWKQQAVDMDFVNSYNERAVQARADFSMREVADEYNATHTQLERAVEGLPDEVEDSLPGLRLIKLLTAGHPNHHAAQIEEWKKTVTGDR